MPKKEKKDRKHPEGEQHNDRLRAQYSALKKLLQKFKPKNNHDTVT